MGGFKKGWYERDEISKITKDWVDINCKTLTDRDMKLLEIVNYRNLVRRDHLEVIHEDYRYINRRTNSINRSIKKLFQKMCIDKVHEEPEFMKGNLPSIISIDRAGAVILNTTFKRRIKHNKKMYNNELYIIRSLPSNYMHIHGINQLEVDTINLSDEYNFDIIRWDLEHDNIKTFMYNEKITLIPDIFMILKIGDSPFISFIEFDTGSEDNRHKTSFPTITDKLNKYHYYKLSNSWLREDWCRFIKSSFPLLIFVTRDEKRIKYVQKKGESLGLNILVCLDTDYKNILQSLLMNP